MTAKGQLIVIEGVDGSGKATQSGLLLERLQVQGHRVRKATFPNYEKDTSALVKMYLRGDFGDSAQAVNPYVASTFYAADRYATYKTELEAFYLGGGILIADRYTQSNSIHQMGKIRDLAERERFLYWLYDFEYNIYALPRPDLMVFLDIHPDVSERLMADRLNKFSGEEKKDIHESDPQHLRDAYEAAMYVIAREPRWVRVNCVAVDGTLRTKEAIHEEVYGHVVASITSAENTV